MERVKIGRTALVGKIPEPAPPTEPAAEPQKLSKVEVRCGGGGNFEITAAQGAPAGAPAEISATGQVRHIAASGEALAAVAVTASAPVECDGEETVLVDLPSDEARVIRGLQAIAARGEKITRSAAVRHFGWAKLTLAFDTIFDLVPWVHRNGRPPGSKDKEPRKTRPSL